MPKFVDATRDGAEPRRGAGRGGGAQRRGEGDPAGRQGAREARAEVLELAGAARRADGAHPQGEGGARARQRVRDRPVGADRQPRDQGRLRGVRRLFLVGTDFPYREFLPAGKTVVQLDVRGEHIGRRTPVDHALVGDARLGLQALLPLLEPKEDRAHLEKARTSYDDWRERQQRFTDPDYERKPGACCAARSTTPRPGSVPSCSPRRSTGTPPPTRSSPPTPGWRRSGSRVSCG